MLKLFLKAPSRVKIPLYSHVVDIVLFNSSNIQDNISNSFIEYCNKYGFLIIDI